MCVASVVDLTDYTELQSNIDRKYFHPSIRKETKALTMTHTHTHIIVLYDECANLGLQLPVLTFPGQSPNRTLSSVAPPSSQTTVATITFIPPPSFFPTTVDPTLPAETGATSTQAPLPSSSSSSGIRSAETSCFNLIASAIMLRLWFYFAVQ